MSRFHAAFAILYALLLSASCAHATVASHLRISIDDYVNESSSVIELEQNPALDYPPPRPLALVADNVSKTSTPPATANPVSTPADDTKCDFFDCHPRNLDATRSDCQFWCNNEIGARDCEENCKCQKKAVKNGGIYCAGFCLVKMKCAANRHPMCNDDGALSCVL